METLMLYTFIFMIIAMIILRFTPNDKINVMGNFFKKVMPTIPLSKIVEAFKKKSE